MKPTLMIDLSEWTFLLSIALNRKARMCNISCLCFCLVLDWARYSKTDMRKV